MKLQLITKKKRGRERQEKEAWTHTEQLVQRAHFQVNCIITLSKHQSICEEKKERERKKENKETRKLRVKRTENQESQRSSSKRKNPRRGNE